ncbi:MAG: metallophosphoesterase [Bacteriovoracaceae bacterium]
MRILKIILIVSPLLLLPPYYLQSRIDLSYWSLVPLLLISTFTFSFPLFRGKKWVKLSYLAMGIMSFLVVCFLLRDLIGLVTQYYLSPLLTLAIAVSSTGIGLWWGRKPRVKKVTIKIDGLPEKLKGLSIIQISDLHVGANITEKYVSQVMEECNLLQPHLIVMTGDIGDSEASIHEKELRSFKQLIAPLGIFYVPGNHEYYWNTQEWVEVMKRIKAIPLLNEGQIIHYQGENILMAGITDPIDRKNPPDLRKPLQNIQETSLKILLSHRPDPAQLADQLGYHLQLSGHTHGGQFFPWTLAVKVIHKHHLGLFTQGKLKIYVSGGTGSWGPLLRLGSSPEITYITLN